MDKPHLDPDYEDEKNNDENNAKVEYIGTNVMKKLPYLMVAQSLKNPTSRRKKMKIQWLQIH